jgi:hypothetical protein
MMNMGYQDFVDYGCGLVESEKALCLSAICWLDATGTAKLSMMYFADSEIQAALADGETDTALWVLFTITGQSKRENERWARVAVQDILDAYNSIVGL